MLRVLGSFDGQRPTLFEPDVRQQCTGKAGSAEDLLGGQLDEQRRGCVDNICNLGEREYGGFQGEVSG